jgi:hypothetical protein
VGAFLDLVARDQVGPVLLGIERAIAESFREDGARMTRSEARRRFLASARIFRLLRGDLHWGLQRALDHLPGYLRCELDGVRWDPDARTIWIPGDGET